MNRTHPLPHVLAPLDNLKPELENAAVTTEPKTPDIDIATSPNRNGRPVASFSGKTPAFGQKGMLLPKKWEPPNLNAFHC